MGKVLGAFALAALIFGIITALEISHFSVGVFGQASLPGDALYPIEIGGQQIYVKLARTPAQQQQGLSGTASLPANNGMLFVFPQDGIYAFWMKDMRYSLDIIWIDSSGRIVYIAPNLSPDSYPQAFESDQPARSVLEVNAGFSARYGVQVGDLVRFTPS